MFNTNKLVRCDFGMHMYPDSESENLGDRNPQTPYNHTLASFQWLARFLSVSDSLVSFQ
jgi:hypothetical protein